MVDWKKIALYTVYINMLITSLTLLLHLTTLGMHKLEQLPEGDDVLSDYIKNSKLSEIINWIAVDVIRLFTTVMLISAIQQRNCDTIIFWTEFKVASAIVFAGVILWHLRKGENSLKDIGFPVVSVEIGAEHTVGNFGESMECTYENMAFALAYFSMTFWLLCVLLHVIALILYVNLESTLPKRCDTALIRFVKTTPIAFHYDSLAADILRAGASVILLKALWDANANMLVNFLRYKYIEVFLLLILFVSRCFRNEFGAFVKGYYMISLVLDISLLYVVFNYCCELLITK